MHTHTQTCWRAHPNTHRHECALVTCMCLHVHAQTPAHTWYTHRHECTLVTRMCLHVHAQTPAHTWYTHRHECTLVTCTCLHVHAQTPAHTWYTQTRVHTSDTHVLAHARTDTCTHVVHVCTHPCLHISFFTDTKPFRETPGDQTPRRPRVAQKAPHLPPPSPQLSLFISKWMSAGGAGKIHKRDPLLQVMKPIVFISH